MPVRADRPGEAAAVFAGRLVAIYVARAAGAPMQARPLIDARAGVGLDGDRYATRLGTYSDRNRGPRDVTLIEREAVEAALADGVAIAEAETRRNLVTEGVPLNHLVDHTFRVGPVLLRGLRLAEPCVYLEQLTMIDGAREVLVHRGGLHATIVEGGTLRIGDPVTPID